MNYATLYIDILGQLGNLQEKGDGKWSARCPAHEDLHNSLSLRIGREGELLVRCHAKPGCPFKVVAGAIKREAKEFFPRHYLGQRDSHKKTVATIVREYDYRNGDGTPAYQTVRYEPKDFRQRRKDERGKWVYNLDGVRRIPFRLPQLLAAPIDQTVLVVEGEKDVESLESLGFLATCNAGGSEKWEPWWLQYFVGRPVAIFPDRDAAGYLHALTVAKILAPVGNPIRIVELPGHQLKDDVTDYLEKQSCPAAVKRLLIQSHIDGSPMWLGTHERDHEEVHQLKMLMARALLMSKCA